MVEEHPNKSKEPKQIFTSWLDGWGLENGKDVGRTQCSVWVVFRQHERAAGPHKASSQHRCDSMPQLRLNGLWCCFHHNGLRHFSGTGNANANSSLFSCRPIILLCVYKFAIMATMAPLIFNWRQAWMRSRFNVTWRKQPWSWRVKSSSGIALYTDWPGFRVTQVFGFAACLKSLLAHIFWYCILEKWLLRRFVLNKKMVTIFMFVCSVG